MEDFLQDIHEVIAYPHTVYDFEKRILIEFFWGTAIGSEYAKLYPENILCYVGVGQLTHYRDGVIVACEKMLWLVPKERKEEKEVPKLLAELPETLVWNRELMKCMGCYAPLSYQYIARHAKRVSHGKILSPPFMNFRKKLAAMMPNYSLLAQSYATMLSYDFKNNLHYDVPVLFIFGEEETICHSELVADCFEKNTASEKKIVILPEAAHACFYDSPKDFSMNLPHF